MCRRIIITISFFLIGLSAGIGQNDMESIKPNRFNVLVGISLYEKGLFTQDTGNVKVTSLNPVSLILGFEYAILQKKNFCVNSGLVVSLEPEDKFKFNYQDLKDGEQQELSHTSFPMYSLSIPILLEYLKPINKNVFFNVVFGARCVFVSKGTKGKYFKSPSNIKLFELDNFDYKDKILGSIVVGCGVKRYLRKTEVGLRLTYVKNFKNIYNGGYRINELINNSITKGGYSISGDYIGVLFSLSIPKFKITAKW